MVIKGDQLKNQEKKKKKKTVTLTIDQHGLSYYHTEMKKKKKKFVVPTGGEYTCLCWYECWRSFT